MSETKHDYSRNTTAALENRRLGIMAQRARLKAEQSVITRELDRRYKEAELKRDLERIEQKHGIQVVAPEGIETAEAHGTPQGKKVKP